MDFHYSEATSVSRAEIRSDLATASLWQEFDEVEVADVVVDIEAPDLQPTYTYRVPERLRSAIEKQQIAGVGLDVTDPEPLSDVDPLWKMTNVVISPHIGGQSDGARDRQWRLFRENVRRFTAGEPLLCVVDKQKGF